jgi:hypothetical protein
MTTSLIDELPVWADRFKDNYYKSVIAGLEALIEECNDPRILSQVGSTLKNGLGGRALNKARKLEGRL